MCCVVLGIGLFYFYVQKQISEIKAAGFILLLGVISFALILSIKVMSGMKGKFVKDYSVWAPHFNTFGLWSNMPTLFLAYGFHATYYPVYNQLKVKTDANGMKATVYSIIICFVIYVTVGIVGVLAFGSDLKGDIMENISSQKPQSWSNYVLMFMFMMIAAMHIPIVFYIGKESILIIVDEILR